MSAEKWSEGLTVEIGDDDVKVFTLTHGLVSLARDECDGAELGDFVWMSEDKYTFDKDDGLAAEMRVTDGVLSLKTMGVTPALVDLPIDIRRKYEGTVYSPLFGLINDPQKLSVGLSEEALKVEVIYRPSNGRVFELIGVEMWPEKDIFPKLGDAPWYGEIAALSRENLILPAPRAPIHRPFVMVRRRSKHIGIVVVKDVRNPNFTKKSQQVPRMHLLFCRDVGLIRIEARFRAELGQLYALAFNDSRMRGSNKDKNHEEALMGTDELRIESDTFETGKVNGNAMVKSAIPFSWKSFFARGAPKENVAFTDVLVGPCYVPPYFLLHIAEIIDVYFGRLRNTDPTKHAARINDRIIVAVEVHSDGSLHSPTNTYFHVAKIDNVQFVDDGESLILKPPPERFQTVDRV